MSLRIVQANEASWEDLRAILCERGYPARCQCQHYTLGQAAYAGVPRAGRSAALSPALEGYQIVTEPGVEITWGEVFVGPLGAFEAAGFVEVHRPSKRRRVMRIEF